MGQVKAGKQKTQRVQVEVGPSEATPRQLSRGARSRSSVPVQRVIPVKPRSAVIESVSVNSGEIHAAAAFQRVLPELQDLSKRSLIPVNLNVASVVARVLALIPGLRPLRPELERSLLDFRGDWFDRLEDYALALHHAQSQYLAHAQPKPPRELTANSIGLRALLLAEVDLLIRRGSLDEQVVERVRGFVGYTNLATDLRTLAQLIETHRAKIEGHSPLALADAERARALAAKLLEAQRARAAASAELARVRAVRDRAFSLLVRAYKETRAGVLYVRRNHANVAELVPSLFSDRGDRGARPRPVDRYLG
ncbi:MAG TPA: hypothetical protein VFQ61_17580 [Polyangiaceae bacterium]|nr:hypothetical protein [Polyangiaceae bacterium]